MLSHAIQPVPATGTLAPDFTLPSTAGQDVTLSAYRGKSAVLLAFFPIAFTSTCTKELCDMRDDYSQYADAGVVLHPISVDSTATLKEFKKQLGMQVDMLSDFKRVVSALYGVLMMDRYYSNRSYFLIDKAGIVRWAHVEESPSHKREEAEILAQIAALG